MRIILYDVVIALSILFVVQLIGCMQADSHTQGAVPEQELKSHQEIAQHEKRGTESAYYARYPAGAVRTEYMEAVLPDKPIVRYPKVPLDLYPQVRNYFYGEDYDPDSADWGNEAADALNFGFWDWHWPGCSTWCGCLDFRQEVRASSERTAAENLLLQNRQQAWAEGVEGAGIGERIFYTQSCQYFIRDPWKVPAVKESGQGPDGFMRYTEICIVNGNAVNQQTWEEYGRVKTLLMLVEDRPYAVLHLEDTIFPQYYTLPEGDIRVLSGKPVAFTFVIEAVYPGSLYEDTCLTGIVLEFSGRYAH